MEVREEEEEGTEDIRRCCRGGESGGKRNLRTCALTVDGSDGATCFRLTISEPNDTIPKGKTRLKETLCPGGATSTPQKNLQRALLTELVDESISYAAAYYSITEPYLPALRALNIHSHLIACQVELKEKIEHLRFGGCAYVSAGELLVSSNFIGH